MPWSCCCSIQGRIDGAGRGDPTGQRSPRRTISRSNHVEVEPHALPPRRVLPVIASLDPGDRAVARLTEALKELLVDGPPALGAREDDDPTGEGLHLLGDRGELQEREPPEDRVVLLGELGEGLGNPGILVEEVVLWG
jgi:hypothetical protein